MDAVVVLTVMLLLCGAGSAFGSQDGLDRDAMREDLVRRRRRRSGGYFAAASAFVVVRGLVLLL